ncbi:hypothetical protein [Psychrobacillus sp. NPDC096623]
MSSYVWFEWQNRAVEREKEKWLEYNGGEINKLKGDEQAYSSSSIWS